MERSKQVAATKIKIILKVFFINKVKRKNIHRYAKSLLLFMSLLDSAYIFIQSTLRK